MASIIWNIGERSVIDAWLGGAGSAASYNAQYGVQVVPSGSGTVGAWGLGMGTRTNGVGSTKADVLAQILELGTTTAAGYARASLTRNQTSWPTSSSLVSGSFQSTAPQQTFTFTAAPSPNGAWLWFLAGSATINVDNCLFGADTAAQRIFANGDTERITPTYRQI